MLSDDLALYFDAFGSTATLTQGGASVTGKVIFDYGFNDMFGNDAEGREIKARVISSQFAIARHGSIIIIDSKTYRVVRVAPINDGATSFLHLQE